MATEAKKQSYKCVCVCVCVCVCDILSAYHVSMHDKAHSLHSPCHNICIVGLSFFMPHIQQSVSLPRISILLSMISCAPPLRHSQSLLLMKVEQLLHQLCSDAILLTLPRSYLLEVPIEFLFKLGSPHRKMMQPRGLVVGLDEVGVGCGEGLVVASASLHHLTYTTLSSLTFPSIPRWRLLRQSVGPAGPWSRCAVLLCLWCCWGIRGCSGESVSGSLWRFCGCGCCGGCDGRGLRGGAIPSPTGRRMREG